MGDVDPDLALFANWVRAEEGRERDARRSAKAVRDEERKAQELVQAKDVAAAELKRIRQDSRASAEQKAAADTAYRNALAAVVTAETGAAPDWAPVVEAPPAEAADDSAADEGAAGDSAAGDAPADVEATTDGTDGTDGADGTDPTPTEAPA